MPSLLDFPRLFFQQIGPQALARKQEPSQVSAEENQVLQYDQVLRTKLVLAYSVALEAIHRARGNKTGGHAMDLACGPGHFTLLLAEILGYSSVIGVDLSEPMIRLARQNAHRKGLTEIAEFDCCDATKVERIHDGELDLTTFCDAAHHLPDLDAVKNVLLEMHRVTAPQGLVFMMDLARLRTAELTERYVKLLGGDYIERGLPQFYEDFRNSMYAAWTADELQETIPRDTSRYWCQIVPRGLPSIQIILGLPIERKTPFVRGGFPWSDNDSIVPHEMRSEWRLLRMTIAMGRRTFVPPSFDR